MNEYQCSRCHTLVHADAAPRNCPTCSGAHFVLVKRDARGNVLPQSAPVGGIITPQ